MSRPPSGVATASAVACALLLAACSGASRPSASQAPGTRLGTREVSGADVHFMSGMIPHHAQAVKIAGWAASHAAGADVRILCERIVVGQRDEIALMQMWLRDRGQPVPAADATHMRMKMGAREHDMLMPGMLSDEELARLEASRGTDFDRLFLAFMIRHHEGAVTMVDALFGSQGAAQDEVVFRLASDIYADQTTEIDRMQGMLAARPSSGREP